MPVKSGLRSYGGLRFYDDLSQEAICDIVYDCGTSWVYIMKDISISDR